MGTMATRGDAGAAGGAWCTPPGDVTHPRGASIRTVIVPILIVTFDDKTGRPRDVPAWKAERMAGDTILHADASGDLGDRGLAVVREMLAVLQASEQTIKVLAERIGRLERLACCDDVTELPNRRGLQDHLGREEARALRYGTPVSVALVVLEGLAELSERYGRLSAEAMLRVAGVALAGAARGSDTVGRLEGDTFLALLPGADAAGSQTYVDRVRAIARFAKLPTGDIVPVRFSVVTATRDEAGTLADALDLAARRLQAATPAP